jgi:hypothetical protein
MVYLPFCLTFLSSYRTFSDRIAAVSQEKAYRKVSKSTRDQIQICIEALNTRAISHRQKLERLRAALDE